MKKDMTRKLICSRTAFFSSLLFLWAASAFALPESPVVQGLSGGGRAGNPREALFGNPASVAFVNAVSGFVHYGMPSIPDYNAGGRMWNVGAYDGGNPSLKGGVGYSRVSRAALGNGRQSYEDISETRFVMGAEVSQNILVGALGRYIGEHQGDGTSHRFDGDIGTIFPLFSNVRAGATLENLVNRKDSQPLRVGVGLYLPLGWGAQLYADGTQLMKGSKKDYKGYSLAADMAIAGDFTVRGGRFQEDFRHVKGWSLGLSWVGPRASFDYAFRVAGHDPRERDHIFGMNVAF